MKFSTSHFLILVLLSMLISGFISDIRKTPKYPDYHLVWSDEFTANGTPNKKNWNYEKGFVRNHEDQWYQKENAFCKDGFLIIEARQEHKINPGFVSKTDLNWAKKRDSIKVTSSCLITQDKHSWQYGRFEMRAKIPTGKGMWPAFWTLGVKENWPANGEIDIMEYYTGKILANAAWKSDKPETAWDSSTFPLTDFKAANWANQFHVWKMDWDANSIKLYVDDQLLNEINIEATIQNKNQKTIPFRQPHYLLVNLAVGGMNGGEFTAASFPSQYIIDYIRVYQKNK